MTGGVFEGKICENLQRMQPFIRALNGEYVDRYEV